jgi:SAM-dependent methyltransferase
VQAQTPAPGLQPVPYRRRTGVCLNMIVKNETPVLERLFRSLRRVIDYYVIVDTGSDDGTPAFIRRWMYGAGIPGEVHQRPWVNFGANRDEALQLAVESGRADWLLLIDADEELVCPDPGALARLTPGVTYELEKCIGALRYALPNLVDVRHNRWRWRGAVHEYLEHLGGTLRREPLKSAWIDCRLGEGARSRGRTPEQKYLADAALLEAELAREPANPRSRFYLAQSYRDAGHLQKAREHYLLRADMTTGWIEETFFARFQAGRMARLLGLPHETVLADLLAAFNQRPCRAEPLHELALHCRNQKRWGEAYAFASAGARLPKPQDRLFVMQDVYQWRLLDELAVAAYWTGHYAISREAALDILGRCEKEGVAVPAADLDRIRGNLRLAEEKLDLRQQAEPVDAASARPAVYSDRTDFAACPLCESPDIADAVTGDCSKHPLYDPLINPVIQWRRCADCGHVFTSGYFTEEAARRVFSRSHDNQKVGHNLEPGRVMASRIVEKVLPHASSGLWLDIGFGNGALLFTAQEYGFSPVGVDVRAENVNALTEMGIEAHCAELSALSLPKPCAVISMMDVLEHMHYPGQALHKVHDLLAPQGVLLLSMPNSESVGWKTLSDSQLNPYWGELEHYHNFSRSRLYALLRDCGFEPVRYGISERYRLCMEVVCIKAR